jgi:hypothetical protein
LPDYLEDPRLVAFWLDSQYLSPLRKEGMLVFLVLMLSVV